MSEANSWASHQRWKARQWDGVAVPRDPVTVYITSGGTEVGGTASPFLPGDGSQLVWCRIGGSAGPLAVARTFDTSLQPGDLRYAYWEHDRPPAMLRVPGREGCLPNPAEEAQGVYVFNFTPSSPPSTPFTADVYHYINAAGTMVRVRQTNLSPISYPFRGGIIANGKFYVGGYNFTTNRPYMIVNVIGTEVWTATAFPAPAGGGSLDFLQPDGFLRGPTGTIWMFGRQTDAGADQYRLYLYSVDTTSNAITAVEELDLFDDSGNTSYSPTQGVRGYFAMGPPGNRTLGRLIQHQSTGVFRLWPGDVPQASATELTAAPFSSFSEFSPLDNYGITNFDCDRDWIWFDARVWKPSSRGFPATYAMEFEYPFIEPAGTGSPQIIYKHFWNGRVFGMLVQEVGGMPIGSNLNLYSAPTFIRPTSTEDEFSNRIYVVVELTRTAIIGLWGFAEYDFPNAKQNGVVGAAGDGPSYYVSIGYDTAALSRSVIRVNLLTGAVTTPVPFSQVTGASQLFTFAMPDTQDPVMNSRLHR